MDDLRPKLDKILADLKSDVAALRTGRATPALVEDIPVEAYGSRQPLKTLAAISIPGAREIVVQPWDRSLLPAVEKAVQSSPLGINPIADQGTIRLALPALTEERKRDLVKLLKEKLEAARIQLRRLRDEARKDIEGKVRAKEVSEDQGFRLKEEVEKVAGECNRKIEELGGAKEREIMAG